MTKDTITGKLRILRLMGEYPANPDSFPDNLLKINKEYKAGMEYRIKAFDISTHRPFNKIIGPFLDYFDKRDIKHLATKLKNYEKGEEKFILFDVKFLAFLITLFALSLLLKLV